MSTVITSHDYNQRTVVPANCFIADIDAHKLEKGLNANNTYLLINILCQRSLSQRLEIAKIFNRIYGTQLPKSIKNRISSCSSFSVLMCGLAIPLHEFFARAIHNSNSFKWMCYIMFILPDREKAALKNYFEESECKSCNI